MTPRDAASARAPAGPGTIGAVRGEPLRQSERASEGTLREWLARHPPDESAFTQTVAGIAERAREGTPFQIAVREFLDEFGLRPERLRVPAIAERPSATGDARQDAFLGALAEHLAAVWDLPRPSWTCEPERFLDRFWFPSAVKGFRAIAIAQSPAAFRRRGIFIAEGTLQRC